jgi:hypothetical protein
MLGSFLLNAPHTICDSRLVYGDHCSNQVVAWLKNLQLPAMAPVVPVNPSYSGGRAQRIKLQSQSQENSFRETLP